MKLTDALFLVVLAVFAIPLLLNPTGWPVAAGIIALLLFFRWVLHHYLDLKKSREFGKASGLSPRRLADRSDLDEKTSQDMTGDSDGTSRRWRRNE